MTSLRHNLLFIALITASGLFGISSMALGQTYRHGASSSDKEDKERGGSGNRARLEARQRFQRGTVLFQDGDFEAALAEFLRAQELAANPLTLYNVGSCYSRMNRYQEAIEYYERALREGQDTLGRTRIGSIRGELERLRSLLATVTVVADVPGAVLILDGEEMGELDGEREIRVPAGTHVFEVAAEGYETARRELTLAGGMVSRLEIELSRQASLRVTARADGARLLLDGRALGGLPYTGGMPSGTHRLRVEGAGYVPWEGDVEGAAGHSVSVRVDLDSTEPGLSPVWFWIDVGLTVVLGVAAIATGVVALARSADYDEVVQQINQGRLASEELADLRSQGQALREEIDSHALAFDVAIGLTAAFAVGALVLAFFTQFGEPESTATIRLSQRQSPGIPGLGLDMALVF